MSKLGLWRDIQSQVPRCRLHRWSTVHAPPLRAAKLGALSKTSIPPHQGACGRGSYLGQPQVLGCFSWAQRRGSVGLRLVLGGDRGAQAQKADRLTDIPGRGPAPVHSRSTRKPDQPPEPKILPSLSSKHWPRLACLHSIHLWAA